MSSSVAHWAVGIDVAIKSAHKVSILDRRGRGFRLRKGAASAVGRDVAVWVCSAGAWGRIPDHGKGARLNLSMDGLYSPWEACLHLGVGGELAPKF